MRPFLYVLFSAVCIKKYANENPLCECIIWFCAAAVASQAGSWLTAQSAHFTTALKRKLITERRQEASRLVSAYPLDKRKKKSGRRKEQEFTGFPALRSSPQLHGDLLQTRRARLERTFSFNS